MKSGTVLLTLGLLFAATTLHADPVTTAQITGGTVTTGRISASGNLEGDTFSFPAFSTEAANIWDNCQPCSGVSPISLSGDFGGHTYLPNSTWQGVQYPTLDSEMGLHVTTPSFTTSMLDSTLSITQPFSLTGQVVGYATPANYQSGPSLFVSGFAGQGMVTAQFREDTAAHLFSVKSAVFDFTNVSQTPEPASLLLLGSGLLGAMWRRSRRSGHPVVDAR